MWISLLNLSSVSILKQALESFFLVLAIVLLPPFVLLHGNGLIFFSISHESVLKPWFTKAVKALEFTLILDGLLPFKKFVSLLK